MVNRRSFLSLALLSTLAACAVGPDHRTPDAPATPVWTAAHLEAAASLPSRVEENAMDAAWWRTFNDPLLTRLVERARAASPELKIAVLRVQQSRAQRGIVAGGRWPSFTARASGQRQRLSEYGSSTRLIDAIGAPGGQRDAIIDVLAEEHSVYQAGFDAAWELDLWGRVRRSVEAADASLRASEEDLHDAQTSLASEVVRAYLEWRGIQEQLRIARSDIQSSEGALELATYRADGGLVSQQDVISRRAQLADVRAQIPQLEQAERRTMNAIELLLGEQPGRLRAELAGSQAGPVPPSSVDIGVPSEVARRRPDIRRAEAQLHATTAQIGVAIADLYPRITLTGGFLAEALQVGDLAEWGARQWTIGPSLQLPIFDGGRRRATIELRQLQQQEAAVNYQRTVLRAWHEIDDALSSFAAEQRRNQELATAVAAARESYELAQLRYERGLTNNLIALDAQRTLLQTQRAYSESTTAISLQLVALYKALGGGWDIAGS